MPGVVMVASHDPAFLDAVCTDVIDLDPAVDGPTRYGGNYSAYLSAQRGQRERWRRRFAEEQEELAVLRRFVGETAREVAAGRLKRDNEKMGSGRVQNQISRRIRNAARRLEALERTRVAPPPEPLRLTVQTLSRPADEGLLVSLGNIRVPGRLTLDNLDVKATDHLLITGPERHRKVHPPCPLGRATGSAGPRPEAGSGQEVGGRLAGERVGTVVCAESDQQEGRGALRLRVGGLDAEAGPGVDGGEREHNDVAPGDVFA
jgi:hypothetical protein